MKRPDGEWRLIQELGDLAVGGNGDRPANKALNITRIGDDVVDGNVLIVGIRDGDPRIHRTAHLNVVQAGGYQTRDGNPRFGHERPTLSQPKNRHSVRS